MLESLYVKDFAIVREAEVAFGPGMTVVSGETGAGKSLLVDALLLLCGARADAAMVRHGATRAELVAGFRVADGHPAAAWLAAQALDDGDACQLRRVVAAEGGSRAWINGRPATIGQLAELGPLLVEIHGQHEHQALLERSHQLALLDAWGDHGKPLAAVRDTALAWREAGRQLQALSGAGDPAARMDWLQHQLTELEQEALAPAEIEALVASHRRQSHGAALLQGCDTALALLDGDEGPAAAALLRQALATLSRLQEHEPRLAEAAAMLDAALIDLDEAAAQLARVRDDLDLDPERLAELDRRLARLHDLARKHRCEPRQLAERRDELAAELEQLRAGEGQLERLRAQRQQLAERWRDAALALGRARLAAAKRLGRAVSALMGELGMAGGRFEVALQPQEAQEPDPAGAERAEFLVSANAGQPPRPLRKVASGGELSRIALAIEVAALGMDDVPTMVFDEVDSGIGGAVAEVVGQKLRALAGERQVLCVTHLPQVAAQGHHHLSVRKDRDGRGTASHVTALDAAARTEELARMLGGIELTPETRAHARRMLQQAQAS
jgi:DNA repair protein RecN (Recombination protein N)